MPERMKRYRLSAFLALMILYLGVQALTGERGLLSGAERDATLARRAAELKVLKTEQADLELRVRYLRADSLSRDLLEERARAVIGYGDPRDYVIHMAHVPVAEAPKPRHS